MINGRCLVIGREANVPLVGEAVGGQAGDEVGEEARTRGLEAAPQVDFLRRSGRHEARVVTKLVHVGKGAPVGRRQCPDASEIDDKGGAADHA